MGHVHDDSPERFAHELGTVGNFIFLRKKLNLNFFSKVATILPWHFLRCRKILKQSSEANLGRWEAREGREGSAHHASPTPHRPGRPAN